MTHKPRRKKNTGSFCCYWISYDKDFLQKENRTTKYDNLGGCATQVDYISVKRTDLELVRNIRIIENKDYIPQHKLLVAVFKIQTPTERNMFYSFKS